MARIHDRKGGRVLVTLLGMTPALVLLPTMGKAQSAAPTVEAVQPISFGVLERLDTIVIDYRSDSAAKFIVIGEGGRRVQLSIVPVDLVRHNGILTLSIAGDQCAYSTDEGVTWTQFDAGALMQEVEFPAGAIAGDISKIYVAVGGTIIVGAEQHRGDYSGSIILNTEYVTGESTLQGEMGGVAAHQRRRPAQERSPLIRHDNSMSVGRENTQSAK